MAFKVKPTKLQLEALRKMTEGFELHLCEHSRSLDTSAFLSPINKSGGMIHVRNDYPSKFREWGWVVMTSDPGWSWQGATYRITDEGREVVKKGEVRK